MGRLWHPVEQRSCMQGGLQVSMDHKHLRAGDAHVGAAGRHLLHSGACADVKRLDWWVNIQAWAIRILLVLL
jgi:hypothetical protein